VHSIAGFPAGGPSDIVTRAVAKRMSELPGQPVVQNRSGAGGRTAVEALARSRLNGVSLLNAALVKIADEKDTQRFLVAQGLEPVTSAREELGRIIPSEIPKFAPIVQAAGIRPE
jgi:tripartite-type tricarboxylate transporter receptor subunit TctC